MRRSGGRNPGFGEDAVASRCAQIDRSRGLGGGGKAEGQNTGRQMRA